MGWLRLSLVAEKLIRSIVKPRLRASSGGEVLNGNEPHGAVGELRMLREDEALALHVQVEPSKSIRQRPRHGQQRLADHVRPPVRQLGIDGRLGRVAIPTQRTSGGE